MISEAVETKLIYETLGSDLIERTLSATRLQIGPWKQCGPGYRLDEKQRAVRHYINTGLPVTFEITTLEDGETLEVTRQRPTFMWEPGFRYFTDWLDNSENTADWMDGIMFRETRPSDFQFWMVDERSTHDMVGIEKKYCVVYFQPLGSTLKDTYDHPTEIENVFANLGKMLPGRELVSNNYYEMDGRYDQVIDYLTDMGFKERKLFVKPVHHSKV